MLTYIKTYFSYSVYLLLLISIGLNWYQKRENTQLIGEIATIELRLKTQQEQCLEAIDILNTEIESYSYNLEDYKTNIETSFNLIDTKYAIIIEEVSKDTTLEGQLSTIESLLHDFSNKK